MADNGLSVNVPGGDEENEENGDSGLSLGQNFDDEEEDVDDERARAALNSPKGDPNLSPPADGVDGGSTPNTLRNQYGVNSPRKKGEIPGGWGAANEGDKGGNAGGSDDVPSGLQGLVTQVSRDDDTAQIMPATVQQKDDDTAQQIHNQTQSSGGLCGCFAGIFGCCSSPPPNNQAVNKSGTASASVSNSKPNAPLIPPASGTGKKVTSTSGNNGNTNGNGTGGGDDEKEESYTETNYPTPGLLPPLLPEHVGKKCLVLDLDETLVHSSFKPIPNPDFIIPVEIDNVVHRVYVMKRPFVDEFLIECAKDYEVVIFTASLAKYADPLLDKLDPHKTITHRLFRESCVLHGTAYVKDLRTLGRKLRDSIIVDNSPPSYLFQPINAIPILSWFDDQTDTQLRDIMPCLKTTLKNIRDVRNILDANTKSYRWLCQQANKDLSIFE